MSEQTTAPEAFVDPLTSLPNRALFMDRLGRAVARRRRGEERELAVLSLDLDRFARVNRRYGREAGDELLRRMADLLRAEVREEDTVARLDENAFAILLDGVDGAADPTHVAERVQRRLREPFRIGDQNVFISVSIGIAFGGGEADEAASLLEHATAAMERAREWGPARYRIFDASTHARAVTLLQLETDLRLAVERHEMVVHYQPILEPDARRIVGLEALVRWSHPSRGLLAPQAFLPVAEETGAIVAIGEQVLRTACTRLRAWRDRHPDRAELFVAVNVSPRQIADPDLLDRVRSALADSGLPAGSLRLEIAESAVVANPGAAQSLLRALHELGVRICIDDFGTGPTLLPSLHVLPVDALKIDGSLVRASDERSVALLGTLAAVARSVGVDLVAEGVESGEQHQRVLELGPAQVQGFLFGLPAEEQAVGALLDDAGPPRRQGPLGSRTTRSPTPMPRSLK